MDYSPDCPNDNKIVTEPHWDQLTSEEQLHFGNGVGPAWFPEWLRKLVTGYASFYFKQASWKHHDFGYTKGYTDEHRREYDDKFLVAMKKDADELILSKKLAALALSQAFYSAVRLGGKASFFFCNRYRSLEEIRELIQTGPPSDETIMPDGMTRGWKEE